jgi:hypothetical protein
LVKADWFFLVFTFPVPDVFPEYLSN